MGMQDFVQSYQTMVSAPTQGILVCTRYTGRRCSISAAKGIFAVSLADKKQSDKLYGSQSTTKPFNGSKDGQRGYLARKYFGSDVIPRLEATKLFQRVWRGQRDRRLKSSTGATEVKRMPGIGSILFCHQKPSNSLCPAARMISLEGISQPSFQTLYLVGRR